MDLAETTGSLTPTSQAPTPSSLHGFPCRIKSKFLTPPSIVSQALCYSVQSQLPLFPTWPSNHIQLLPLPIDVWTLFCALASAIPCPLILLSSKTQLKHCLLCWILCAGSDHSLWAGTALILPSDNTDHSLHAPLPNQAGSSPGTKTGSDLSVFPYPLAQISSSLWGWSEIP